MGLGARHTQRLRARDRYTSSTLIGRKGPSSLHTIRRGTDGVCECKMMDVTSTWIFKWHQIDHVSWALGSFSENRLLEVGLTKNSGENRQLVIDEPV